MRAFSYEKYITLDENPSGFMAIYRVVLKDKYKNNTISPPDGEKSIPK